MFVMGDFNITQLSWVLKHADVHTTFLLCLQNFSLISTVDQPNRAYENSVTSIDNIVVNKLEGEINSGNILSDISVHYLQFCIFYQVKERSVEARKTTREFSRL